MDIFQMFVLQQKKKEEKAKNKFYFSTSHILTHSPQKGYYILCLTY